MSESNKPKGKGGRLVLRPVYREYRVNVIRVSLVGMFLTGFFLSFGMAIYIPTLWNQIFLHAQKFVVTKVL